MNSYVMCFFQHTIKNKYINKMLLENTKTNMWIYFMWTLQPGKTQYDSDS